MPNVDHNRPRVVNSAHRHREPPFTPLPTLAQYAPLTLVCMCCRTVRIATPDRIVLWHRDDLEPAFECAGAGAPGLDLEYAA
jgi:hypothetical protein